MIQTTTRYLGYRKGEDIYLHKDLSKPEYKTLKEYILKHELKHAPGKHTLQDLVSDMECNPPKKELYAFYLKHPLVFLNSWNPISPDGKPDPTLTLLYLAILTGTLITYVILP